MIKSADIFLKLAALGAIVFLPTKGGKFLMQDDKKAGGYRPPGGHADKTDHNLTHTIVREIQEEFGLSEEETRTKLKFLGYAPEARFWNNAIFELKDHGLKAKTYQASNSVDEKVKLVEISLDDPKYIGPRPEDAITAEEKVQRELADPELKDGKIRSASIDWAGRLKALRARRDLGKDEDHHFPIKSNGTERTHPDRLEQRDGGEHAKHAGDNLPPGMATPGPGQPKGAGTPAGAQAGPLESAAPKTGPAKALPLVHYSRGSFDELRPLTYAELLRDRTSGRWEHDAPAARAYTEDRRKTEAVYREKLKALGLESDQETSFLYATVPGYESYGQPGTTRHESELDPEQLKSTLFDVVGLPEELLHPDGPQVGQAGLDDALARWEAHKDKLQASQHMGMTIRPRVEVITPHRLRVNQRGTVAGDGVKTAMTMVGPPKTGPEAIEFALKNLNLDQIEKDAHDVIKRKLKSKRPDAVKKLGFIQGFRRSGITPGDLVVRRVPVIPPGFRPYSVAGDTFIPGDANELYRDLVNVRDTHSKLEARLGPAGAAENKLHIYDAVSAVYGFGEAVSPKTRERGVSGFLKKITGANPKFSFAMRKLLSRDSDFTGRGVIGVDPDLGMDQIGVPEEMLWKLYAPYVQRRLVRGGMSASEAVRAIKERSSHASKMLDAELPERPVMYSRAPAWHKFNSLGGYAKRIKGDAILINPLTTSGMNADFDGDTLNIHVVSLPEAVEDVKDKLMPSKMLFSIKDPGKVVPVPKQETILGLYQAQTSKARNTHQFATEVEALQAIQGGKVRMSDEIQIGPPPALVKV